MLLSDDWYNFQFPVTTPDPAAQCDSLCVRGTVVNEADTRSGGVWTGGYTLKPASSGPFVNCYCELYTWCPDENIPDSSIGGGPFEFKLKGVENWTVSFRQNVEFKAFNTITTNLSPKDSKVPPLWPIGEMIRQTGYSYDEARAYGAVIVMQSDWNCNLDYSVDSCNPTVSFVSLANSFNFRRVEYTSTDGIDGARQLIKHFGIRIIVILTGTAGKFDMAALLTTIGSGIGKSQHSQFKIEIAIHTCSHILSFLHCFSSCRFLSCRFACRCLVDRRFHCRQCSRQAHSL